MTAPDPEIAAAFQAAVEHHRAGEAKAAEQGYRALLQRDPNHPDAHHNLGVMLMAARKTKDGLRHLKAALEANPVEGQFWFSYAGALIQTGAPGDALSVLRQGNARGLKGPQYDALTAQGEAALKRAARPPAPKPAKPSRKSPAEIPALMDAAVKLHQAGKLAEATARYREILSIDPRNAGAMHLAGVAAKQSKQPLVAEEMIRAAIALQPGIAEFHGNLGVVLRELGRLDEAAAAHAKAIAINPGYVDAHNNLGNVLRDLERLDEARASYEKALALRPGHVDCIVNIADVLQQAGKYKPAFERYNEALRLDPAHAKARMNLATAYFAYDDLENAIALYRQAIGVDPRAALLHNNLGLALQAQGLHAEALASFQRALKIDPKYPEAHSNLLLGQNYSPATTKEQMIDAAARFSSSLGPRPKAEPHRNSRDPEKRLRVGLVSADLRTHPVGFFLAGVLPRIDKAKFEIVCYSNDARSDAMTKRIAAASDGWRSLVGVKDRDAAETIRRDGIDILLDLSGHTAKNRLALFARRPAPLQASWLGYFSTTGLREIDAVLLDDWTSLRGEEDLFIERVVHLPGGRFCYEPPAYAPAVKPPPAAKNGYVTFGSFNNLSKMNDAVWAAWAKILKAAPDARLILKWKTLSFESERKRVAAVFAAAGGDTGRLELRGGTPHAKMLDEYADIDVALDPFPFCGGLTSCEALWMGVPVLTLPGARPVSRQTYGFLAALGLDPDFAVQSEAAYVARAASIARAPGELAALRASLRERMAQSRLCNARLFAANFETTLRDLWRGWCARQR